MDDPYSKPDRFVDEVLLVSVGAQFSQSLCLFPKCLDIVVSMGGPNCMLRRVQNPYLYFIPGGHIKNSRFQNTKTFDS